MRRISKLVLILFTNLVWLNPHASAAEGAHHPGEMKQRTVRYEDFGARGDGVTDDVVAIAKAHAFANKHDLTIKAKDDAKYYIGQKDHTVVIQSNTDFGTANFIIDDSIVDNRKAHIFEVRSKLKPIKPLEITSLKRNQAKLMSELTQACLIRITDSSVKRFIRKGLNQNGGSSQTDVFVVDQDGVVDPNSPILWDFDQISHIIAYPMDSTTLTITGGRFTTIANAEESKYNYFARGISIKRSNVVIDGLEHRISGEGEQGAPYSGFINISNCANVTVRNTKLSGHKTYRTIGSAGKPVSMGSYDLSITRAINVSLVNCNQFNDIMDRTRWGIMASNFCKKLVIDHCKLSRFDAHQGVTGATIRNSTLGHMGINAIGSGTFLVENSTVNGSRFINLRSDYGSSWQGEFVIRNCTFTPPESKVASASLIGGSNNGQHDFGYICYMPNKIIIDGLYIDDSQHSENYEGPTLFANFNTQFIDATYKEKYPYVKTREVFLHGIRTASGKPLRISKNSFMFKDVVVKTKLP